MSARINKSVIFPQCFSAQKNTEKKLFAPLFLMESIYRTDMNNLRQFEALYNKLENSDGNCRKHLLTNPENYSHFLFYGQLPNSQN